MTLETASRARRAPKLGTIRYIDQAKVLSALSVVRRGDVISLNLPLDGPPLVDPPAGRPALRRGVRMHNQIRPRSDGSFVVVNDDVIELAMQGSTHWDALAHWGAIEPGDDSVYFGGAGLSETYPQFGAKTLGIDHLAAGVVTRGVLLDFVRQMEEPEALFLEDGHNIGLADVQTCLERERLELAPGDAVFTYTGFQQRLGRGRFAPNGPDGQPRERQAPGLLLETLPFWEQAKIFALCSDNPSVEPIPMPEGRFHTVALKHMGIQLGELFALEELVEECRRDGVYQFVLVSTPLNVRGAFGSPANAVAIR
jgi:kynurenine formamidase